MSRLFVPKNYYAYISSVDDSEISNDLALKSYITGFKLGKIVISLYFRIGLKRMNRNVAKVPFMCNSTLLFIGCLCRIIIYHCFVQRISELRCII